MPSVNQVACGMFLVHKYYRLKALLEASLHHFSGYATSSLSVIRRQQRKTLDKSHSYVV